MILFSRASNSALVLQELIANGVAMFFFNVVYQVPFRLKNISTCVTSVFALGKFNMVKLTVII